MTEHENPGWFESPEAFRAWLDKLSRELGAQPFHRAAKIRWSIEADTCGVCPVHYFVTNGWSFIDWSSEMVVAKRATDLARAIRTSIAKSHAIDIYPQIGTRGSKRRLAENFLVSVWEEEGNLLFSPVVRAWRNRKKKSLLGKPARERREVPTSASDQVLLEAAEWAISVAKQRDLELF